VWEGALSLSVVFYFVGKSDTASGRKRRQIIEKKKKVICAGLAAEGAR
jgi:hypothetical protein